jgi:hypothetical protein
MHRDNKTSFRYFYFRFLLSRLVRYHKHHTVKTVISKDIWFRFYTLKDKTRQNEMSMVDVLYHFCLCIRWRVFMHMQDNYIEQVTLQLCLLGVYSYFIFCKHDLVLSLRYILRLYCLISRMKHYVLWYLCISNSCRWCCLLIQALNRW